jgi:glycosyltransferase involved in cell wall biosynthesis
MAESDNDKRILVFAYACEPGRGSEPGAGWMLSRLIANLGEACIITREGYRSAIESALPETPERQRLHFEFVQLPRWMSFWKKGQRGIRLHYLLWQIAALRRARSLNRSRPFDYVWHVTLANAWLGSTAGFVGPPFIYGPIGGGVSPPWRLVPSFGARGAAYEVVRALIRLAYRWLNPLTRPAWARAQIILVQNDETRRWLPRRHCDKAVVFHNAIVDDLPAIAASARSRSKNACYAGRLLAWKGMSLALEALARTEGWRLAVFGDGTERPRLERLAHELGIADRVDFRGERPRGEVLDYLRQEADVLLFPSLHDDAGLIVAEAVTCGVRVICLDRGGPPTLAPSSAVIVSPRGARKTVVLRLARALDASEAWGRPGEEREDFSLDARLGALREVLDQHARSRPTSALLR